MNEKYLWEEKKWKQREILETLWKQNYMQLGKDEIFLVYSFSERTILEQ